MQVVKELPLLSETPMLKREVGGHLLRSLIIPHRCYDRRCFGKSFNYAAQCSTSRTPSQMCGARS